MVALRRGMQASSRANLCHTHALLEVFVFKMNCCNVCNIYLPLFQWARDENTIGQEILNFLIHLAVTVITC